MSWGQFTYKELDNSIFEHIRREVVAQGYYPNLVLFQPTNPTNINLFNTALNTIKGTGKTPINTVGNMVFKDKGEMKLNTLYIHRVSKNKGSIAMFDTQAVRTDGLTTAPNNSTTYSVIESKGFTQDIQYEIRFVSKTQADTDLMSNIIQLALTFGRDYFNIYDLDTNSIVPNKQMLLEFEGEQDLNIFEYKEIIFRFSVLDAWIVTNNIEGLPDGVSQSTNQSIVPITNIIGSYGILGQTMPPDLSLPTENLFINIDASSGVNGGVVSDGDLIYIIVDSSGNNNYFLQLIGVHQPTWKRLGINGVPSIDFTVLSYLYNQGMSIGSDSVSFFTVVQRKGPAIGPYGNILILSVPSYTAAGNQYLQINEGRTAHYAFNSANPTLRRTLVSNTNTPIMLGFVKSPTQVEYFVDGVSVGIQLGSHSISAIQHYLGSWLNSSFNGYMGQFLLYKEVLNTAKIDKVHAFLKNKFKL